jgi:hypothetical protein
MFQGDRHRPRRVRSPLVCPPELERDPVEHHKAEQHRKHGRHEQVVVQRAQFAFHVASARRKPSTTPSFYLTERARSGLRLGLAVLELAYKRIDKVEVGTKLQALPSIFDPLAAKV